MAISVSFIKKTSVIIFSYMVGYFHFSIVWVLIPTIFELWRTKYYKDKLEKRDLIRSMATMEEKDVIGSFANLPAWVCFPDMERVEWVNKIIKQLWPNINNYVHDVIKDLMEEKISKKLEKYKLSGLVFDKLIVGNMPFRIGGIVVYDTASRNEIVFDADIMYAGDCDISLKYSKVKGGIKDFQLYGKLRVIVKPLINTLPLAGGLQLFFLNPPEIDFNLDGLAGVLEIPGIIELIKKLILETICSVIVLPNKYPIRLSKTVSKEDIKIPQPQGVLRVHVIQARKLVKRDLTFSGRFTSDPYAMLTIGGQQFKTPVKEHTARPKWDYWCEFIIEEINGVYLYISLWDEDTLQEDEPLGNAKILISKLVERGQVDMWCTLQDVKHGEVQIRSTWLSLSPNQEDLKTILFEVQQLQVTTLSSAVLTVFVDSVTNLIEDIKSIKPYVKVVMGTQEFSTRTFNKKVGDPKWEEGFSFLVSNPEIDFVIFQLIDAKEEKLLGELIFNISTILEENGLIMEKKPFGLSKCESEASIFLSMNLKIIKNNSLDIQSQNSTVVSDGCTGKQKQNVSDAELLERSSLSSLSSESSDSSACDSKK